MIPETYLGNIVPIYSEVLSDLEKGDNLPADLLKVEKVINELDVLISSVSESGGKTKGYQNLKNTMVTLKKEISEKISRR